MTKNKPESFLSGFCIKKIRVEFKKKELYPYHSNGNAATKKKFIISILR